MTATAAFKAEPAPDTLADTLERLSGLLAANNLTSDQRRQAVAALYAAEAIIREQAPDAPAPDYVPPVAPGTRGILPEAQWPKVGETWMISLGWKVKVTKVDPLGRYFPFETTFKNGTQFTQGCLSPEAILSGTSYKLGDAPVEESTTV